MTWTYTDDYYREYTRTTWNESARVYLDLFTRLEPFRQDLLRDFQAKAGERVLDIATGPGEPAMTLARAVGPRGSVVGVDLSEEMVKLAREVAAKRNLANVEFLLQDAERMTLPEASFDGAVSAFGFQIVTDPEKAAQEALRVLKPGGRLAVTVWGPGERCPAIHAIIGPMLEHAEPDETGYLPTPYEMGGPGEMVAFLGNAGFQGAKERRVDHDWVFRDADHYLELVLGGTPIGHSLREEDKEVQEEVLRKTRQNVQSYAKGGEVRLPAEAVVVTARKPA
jgi:SAM-dependent methyltransferase